MKSGLNWPELAENEKPKKKSPRGAWANHYYQRQSTEKGKEIMHDEIEKIKSRLKVGSYCFRMLCYLEQGGTFTVWEARDLFGCTSALVRVAELRALGVPIVSTPEDNHVRYSIGEAV